MTHYDQSNASDDVVHLLAEHGFDGMAQAIETLFNEAPKPSKNVEEHDAVDRRRVEDPQLTGPELAVGGLAGQEYFVNFELPVAGAPRWGLRWGSSHAT